MSKPLESHKIWMSALYLLSIVSLSQAASLIRLAQAPPDIIGTWRLGLAALALAPFALKKEYRENITKAPEKTLTTIVASGLFFYTHLWTYFYAIHHTTIARCMIIFATNPIFATLGGRIFLHEKLYPRFYVAFPLAFCGLLLLFWDGLVQGTPGASLNLGDGAALVSAGLYAAYILTGKKARAVTANVTYSFFIYMIAAILFIVIGSLQDLNFFSYPTTTWLALLGTVLIPTFLGHFLFSYLLRFMNAGMMTTGKLLEPIIASLMALWLFSEPLSANIFMAFVLTGSAIVILLFA